MCLNLNNESKVPFLIYLEILGVNPNDDWCNGQFGSDVTPDGNLVLN